MTRRGRIALVSAGLVLATSLSACSGDDEGAADGSPDVTPARLVVAHAPVGRDGDDTVPAYATFRPRQPGAPVVVERRAEGRWSVVARGRQDVAGSFRTSLDLAAVPEGSVLRATTRPGNRETRATSEPTRVSLWREVWRDDFDGYSLDPDKWRTRVQRPNGRRLCSTPDASRVWVEDGQAVLSVKRIGPRTSACPYGVFHNGMIGTSVADFPGFTATYGTFAARVKFQAGRGQHGSFWLQSVPATSDTGAEIDVAEYFGSGRPDGGLSNFVHHTDGDDKLTSAGGIRKGIGRLLDEGETPANSWHVYSVEWTPDGYVFRMDGVPTLETSKPYVAKTPEFMVLSLLTSDWELPRVDLDQDPDARGLGAGLAAGLGLDLPA